VFSGSINGSAMYHHRMFFKTIYVILLLRFDVLDFSSVSKWDNDFRMLKRFISFAESRVHSL
jgi:hypothetical protein